MHDKWQKGFKEADILLCLLALWPLAQMLFCKSPLQDIHPIQLNASEPTPTKEPDKDKSIFLLPEGQQPKAASPSSASFS